MNTALVIIPTYNECETIEQIVPAVLEVEPRVDVLIVDDASPDGTGRLADTLADNFPQVHVLHREKKDGLGAAYIAGFQWGLARQYDRFIEMDADFSHDPKSLPELLDLSHDYHLVLGSRYVLGGGTEGWSLGRQILSRGGSLYARSILGIPVRDLTCGFKCFRREVLEAMDLNSITTKGYGFQIEMTYRAYRGGFRVHEVPIVFRERRAGKSKMNSAIFREAVLAVWKMRFLDSK